MAKAENEHYLSNKEARNIIKENRKQMRHFEKQKKAKVPESFYLAEMQRDNTLIEIDNLHIYFYTDNGTVKAVNGVSFDIPENSIVGVVGESGCGKSVTSLAVMRLIQGPQGQIVDGSIRFKASDFVYDEKGKPKPIYVVDENGEIVYEEKTNKKGEVVKDKDGNLVMIHKVKRDENGFFEYETVQKTYDIAKMPINKMRKLRGKEIAMIFQEPMTSLNPVFTIGNQLDEAVLINNPGVTAKQAKEHSIKKLAQVGIAMPEAVYKKYPHELSGGMRQRVMIAMAISSNPRLIIADEPTTALDVTIQAQILDLLAKIKNEISGSIMLITHDLGVIAGRADYVIVMYAGRIVETGTVYDIFDHPMHPYTIDLQKSKPVINRQVDELYSIPGNVPNPINMPKTCYFKDRCSRRCEKCEGDYPELIKVSETHSVSCHLYRGDNNG